MPTKPLNENLSNVLVLNEDGELLPVLDDAGNKFRELVNAVVARGKAGTLKLTISVKPSTAGALAVKSEVAIKKPQGLPAESLLWATPEGNLLGEDPRQTKLDLREVPKEPVRVLKVAAA
jgi:hypothetical protein